MSKTYQSSRNVNFAYSVPWSYNRNQFYVGKMYKIFNNNGDYFFRELLCYSFEGLKVELLTITSRNKMDSEREDYFGDSTVVFPKQEPRPNRFNKNYVLVSARAHPGETPSSFMIKGLLDSLGVPSSDSQSFLDNFVLLVVPMLNPDGVYRGYQRLDALGFD
jgi:hypothetical protein